MSHPRRHALSLPWQITPKDKLHWHTITALIVALLTVIFRFESVVPLREIPFDETFISISVDGEWSAWNKCSSSPAVYIWIRIKSRDWGLTNGIDAQSFIWMATANVCDRWQPVIVYRQPAAVWQDEPLSCCTNTNVFFGCVHVYLKLYQECDQLANMWRRYSSILITTAIFLGFDYNT